MAKGPDHARKWSTLELLAVLGTALTAAVTNPGFVARVSQKGLDFACQQGVTAMQKEMNTITVPNFSGRFKIKYFGQGSYSFHDMIVDEFQLPSPQIQLQPSDGLELSINQASVKIKGRWKARKSLIKGSGKFSLTIEDIAISADLRVNSDNEGRISISCASCSSPTGKVRVSISGGMVGWLIQLFHKKIESSLQNTMHSKEGPLWNVELNSHPQDDVKVQTVE